MKVIVSYLRHCMLQQSFGMNFLTLSHTNIATINFMFLCQALNLISWI